LPKSKTPKATGKDDQGKMETMKDLNDEQLVNVVNQDVTDDWEAFMNNARSKAYPDGVPFSFLFAVLSPWA
jgi:hypothetical protein